MWKKRQPSPTPVENRRYAFPPRWKPPLPGEVSQYRSEQQNHELRAPRNRQESGQPTPDQVPCPPPSVALFEGPGRPPPATCRGNPDPRANLYSPREWQTRAEHRQLIGNSSSATRGSSQRGPCRDRLGVQRLCRGLARPPVRLRILTSRRRARDRGASLKPTPRTDWTVRSTPARPSFLRSL